MNFSITLFKNIYDNKTDKRVDLESYDQFKDLLFKMSKVNYPDKKSASLMSPSIYTDDGKRRNINVTAWAGWAALDIDNWDVKNYEIKDHLSTKFNYICYSTASNTEEKSKFRLIFPLTRHIEKDKIPEFWYALNTEYGSHGDKQVKDMSRMYYVPGTYAGDNFFFTHEYGKNIDPDELIKKHPTKIKSNSKSFFDNLPKNIQAEIIEHRKSTLDNKEYSWSSYHNCPFFPKKLGNDYRMITGTGWYHKMFTIMVAISSAAVKKKYPITPEQIAQMCIELDNETGGWYKNRPLIKEANRALEYVYKTVL